MKRSGMVLFGAFLWLAWHVGTLSAPAPQSAADINSGRWGRTHSAQPAASSAPGSNIVVGLQRFAVESERFLGHSAHFLESDWHRIHPLANASQSLGGQAEKPPVSEATASTGNNTFQSGLAMAWHEVEPLLISIQRAGWETVQFGWRQLTQGQPAGNPSNPNSSNQRSADDSIERGHARPSVDSHGWHQGSRRVADAE